MAKFVPLTLMSTTQKVTLYLNMDQVRATSGLRPAAERLFISATSTASWSKKMRLRSSVWRGADNSCLGKPSAATKGTAEPLGKGSQLIGKGCRGSFYLLRWFRVFPFQPLGASPGAGQALASGEPSFADDALFGLGGALPLGLLLLPNVFHHQPSRFPYASQRAIAQR